jgi:hypothetical protein
MAEPLDYEMVSMRINRDFLASRLEKQLLAKVYGILVPAAPGRCPRPLSSSESVPSVHRSGITSQTKGV